MNATKDEQRLRDGYFERVREHQQMGAAIVNDLIAAEGIDCVILKAEQRSLMHLGAFERFSMLPHISANNDELLFLGTYSKEYLPNYYLIRGMAADVRDKKPVDRALVAMTFALLYGLQRGLEDAVMQVYRQELYIMAGDSRPEG